MKVILKVFVQQTSLRVSKDTEAFKRKWHQTIGDTIQDTSRMFHFLVEWNSIPWERNLWPCLYLYTAW